MSRFLFIILISSTLAACSSGGSSSTSSSSSTSTSSSSTSSTGGGNEYLQYEHLSGGEASTARLNSNDAFSQSPHAITLVNQDDGTFKQGNRLFSDPRKNDGPLLNNHTCQGCHVKDGRGNPPINSETPFASILMKLSLGVDADNNPIPDPIYGTQLQTYGLDQDGNEVTALHQIALDEVTVTGEAEAFIVYEELPGQFADGEAYSLRKPTYRFKNPAYGAFSEGLLTSPRVAPPMIGLGLLGAIPEADIMALADDQALKGDGISGQARFVNDFTSGQNVLGRYGWKATTGSVLQQASGAASGDMGLSSRFVGENCSNLQISCLARAEEETARGEVTDLNDIFLASIEFYSRLLAVPERSGYDTISKTWQPNITAGKQLFIDIECSTCHVPHHKTGAAKPSTLGVVTGLTRLEPSSIPIAVLSNQDIWPYTDLLLHDMGGTCEPMARETINGTSCNDDTSQCQWVQRCEGLADGRPEGTASGSEWRTSPLWGIGLALTVNPKAGFLHDGRARNLTEAIIWHNGESKESKDKFMALSATEREQLLDYLNSL